MAKPTPTTEKKQVLLRIEPRHEKEFDRAIYARGYPTRQAWFAAKVEEELAWAKRSKAAKKAAKSRQTELSA